MIRRKDHIIKSSLLVVRIALLGNRLFFSAVLLGLLLSWPLSRQFAMFLLQQSPGVDWQSEMTGLRFLMLLGAAMSVGTEILLGALAEITASAGAGDPFIAANARKLRTIGWALLGLQLLDIPGALLGRYFPSLGSAAPDITFSPGSWIAVLMVFVLSRVFAAGSAMRDDLEGMV